MYTFRSVSQSVQVYARQQTQLLQGGLQVALHLPTVIGCVEGLHSPHDSYIHTQDDRAG